MTTRGRPRHHHRLELDHHENTTIAADLTKKAADDAYDAIWRSIGLLEVLGLDPEDSDRMLMDVIGRLIWTATADAMGGIDRPGAMTLLVYAAACCESVATAAGLPLRDRHRLKRVVDGFRGAQ